jgi:hypothetical protein
MLGHFVFVDNAADRERNFVLAAQRLFGAMNADRNGGEFLLLLKFLALSNFEWVTSRSGCWQR